jgi:hypothetical protein
MIVWPIPQLPLKEVNRGFVPFLAKSLNRLIAVHQRLDLCYLSSLPDGLRRRLFYRSILGLVGLGKQLEPSWLIDTESRWPQQDSGCIPKHPLRCEAESGHRDASFCRGGRRDALSMILRSSRPMQRPPPQPTSRRVLACRSLNHETKNPAAQKRQPVGIVRLRPSEKRQRYGMYTLQDSAKHRRRGRMGTERERIGSEKS